MQTFILFSVSVMEMLLQLKENTETDFQIDGIQGDGYLTPYSDSWERRVYYKPTTRIMLVVQAIM
ncbi:hypothetical protein C0J52_01240 [Blattella germanica]|nr:hypothetical protein C0J52_01240 [Blattella germanica]